jgi:hypothetical protein
MQVTPASDQSKVYLSAAAPTRSTGLDIPASPVESSESSTDNFDLDSPCEVGVTKVGCKPVAGLRSTLVEDLLDYILISRCTEHAFELLLGCFSELPGVAGGGVEDIERWNESV